MAKLNTKAVKTVTRVDPDEVTTNFHGETAYKLSDEQKLVEQTVGAFWNENLFYQKGKDTSNSIVNLVKRISKVNPKSPLQVAVWARNEMFMRTTPQVILVEAANIAEAEPFIREFAPRIVRRADELAEVIAYQLSTYGKPIPNSLKKGLAAAFANFDEYQLAKYDSSGASVKLGDVLRLVHREANYPVSKAMREYLVNGTVDADALPKIAATKRVLAGESLDAVREDIAQSGVTWENLISKFGSSKATWEAVVPQMGYMALLRNLRNFEQKGVDLAPILERITNEKAVRNSKQLPFRFFSAYKQTSDNRVRRAVAKALDISLNNAPIEGSTAVMVDLSGSMTATLSDKSDVTYQEVGALLGAIAYRKAADSVMIGFGSTAAEAKINPDDTTITNVEKIIRLPVGHATNAIAAFDVLGTRKVDRIILVSDMQCYASGAYGWGGSNVKSKFEDYVRNVNKNAWLYSLDVSAYGTSTVPKATKNAVTISGWSDKILDFINLNETGGKQLLEHIRSL